MRGYPAPRTLRFNIQRVSTEWVATQYCQQLDEQLKRIDVSGDVNNYTRGCRNNGARNDWYDEEGQRVTDMKIVGRSRMLVAETKTKFSLHKTLVFPTVLLELYQVYKGILV